MLRHFRFHNLVDQYRRIFPDLVVDIEQELEVYKVSFLSSALTWPVAECWSGVFVTDHRK